MIKSFAIALTTATLLSAAAYAHPTTKMSGNGYGIWEYRTTPPSKTPAMTWMPGRIGTDPRMFSDLGVRPKSAPTSHFTK